MKKKIKLTDFKVESFITGVNTNINTKDFQGGWPTQSTNVEPTSGPCIECVVTSPDYSLHCCGTESVDYCDTHYDCGPTGFLECTMANQCPTYYPICPHGV